MNISRFTDFVVVFFIFQLDTYLSLVITWVADITGCNMPNTVSSGIGFAMTAPEKRRELSVVKLFSRLGWARLSKARQD